MKIYLEEYNITANFQSNNVTVEDSYKVTSRNTIEKAISAIREISCKNQYKRSLRSWYYEWVAHNWLYYHNIAPKRTASVDLNDDEVLWKRFGYFLITLISYL